MKIMMIVAMVVLNGCFGRGDFSYIPARELNGKVLVDTTNGKRYKLEWQDGEGNSWRFLEERKSSNDGSSEWAYNILKCLV